MLSTQEVTAEDPSMPDEVKTTKDLRDSDVFEGKAIDGLSFRRIGKPEDSRWTFNFVIFHRPVVFEHNNDLGIDKWAILLFEPDSEGELNVVYYTAFIGDPLRFAKNHVAAGVQGMLFKKSIPGYDLIMKAVGDIPLDKMRPAIERDIEDFKKKYK